MRWRERAQEADEKLKELPHLHRLKEALDLLLVPVLLVLIVVLYLEFFAHLSHAQHKTVLLVEKGILIYFLAELGVDFIIYEERRRFFHDRWLDILLVMPFFMVFRSVNAALRSLRALKLIKPAKTAKVAKSGKVAKTGKVAKVVKPIEAARLGSTSEAIHAAKGTQKMGKIVTKLQHLLEDLR